MEPADHDGDEHDEHGGDHGGDDDKDEDCDDGQRIWVERQATFYSEKFEHFLLPRNLVEVNRNQCS